VIVTDQAPATPRWQWPVSVATSFPARRAAVKTRKMQFRNDVNSTDDLLARANTRSVPEKRPVPLLSH